MNPPEESRVRHVGRDPETGEVIEVLEKLPGGGWLSTLTERFAHGPPEPEEESE